jgi:hypothetical protein
MVIDPANVAWSCVVDDTPAIWSSLVPWIATAIDLAGIAPSRLYVHHVCPLRPEIAALCRRLTINTRAAEPFDRRFPHTNKIRQFATSFGDAGHVILTDVDIAFASPPPLHHIRTPVAGKVVDLPNPSVEILRRIFAVAGLSAPAIWMNAFVNAQDAWHEFETFLGNCNGGLLVIDRDQLAPIGRAWAQWARWLIDRVDLLDRWAVHVDQVSFCLAVNQLGVDVGRLDDAWNFPMGVGSASSDIEPFLLHHHAAFENHRLPERGYAARTRETIARVNGAIASFSERHLSGRTDADCSARY